MALPGAQSRRPVGRTFVSSEVLAPLLDEEKTGGARELVVREGHHHLTRVLRCRQGEVVELFDGEGLVARGTIRAMAKDHLIVAVQALYRAAEPAPPTILLSALLKAPAMDSVVRKATELGVSRLFVAATERSVPARDEKAGKKRLVRWARIASEACLQSGRPIPPEIQFFSSWEKGLDVLDALGEGGRIILQPGAETSLADIMANVPRTRSLALALGPEGGFGEAELAEAARRGWVSGSMGALVLRAETAALVAAAFMAQAAGRFDPGVSWIQSEVWTVREDS